MPEQAIVKHPPQSHGTIPHFIMIRRSRPQRQAMERHIRILVIGSRRKTRLRRATMTPLVESRTNGAQQTNSRGGNGGSSSRFRGIVASGSALTGKRQHHLVRPASSVPSGSTKRPRLQPDGAKSSSADQSARSVPTGPVSSTPVSQSQALAITATRLSTTMTEEDSVTLEQLVQRCKGRNLELGLRSTIPVAIWANEVVDFFKNFQRRAFVGADHIKAMFNTILWPADFVVLDPHIMNVDLSSVDRLPAIAQNREPLTPWLRQRSTKILAPYNPGDHWMLLVATVIGNCGVIDHYDSLNQQHPDSCSACLYLHLMLDRTAQHHWDEPLTWLSVGKPAQSRRQARGSNDCGMWTAWNAEMLARGQDVMNPTVQYPKDLRLYYAQRIVQQAEAEEPDRSVDSIIKRPRRMRPPRATSGISYLHDENEDLKRMASSCTSPVVEWMKIVSAMRLDEAWRGALALVTKKMNTTLKTPITQPQALHLLELAVALGHPQYFVHLRSIIVELRRRAQDPNRRRWDLDKRNIIFYYQMGLEADHITLLSNLKLRLVHTFYAREIENETKRLAARGPPTRRPVAEITVGETGQAVTRAKARVAEIIIETIYSSSLFPAPNLETVIKRLETWRRRGGIWMALEERYSMEVLHMLVPQAIELLAESRTVLVSEYELLPVGKREAFFEILDDLRPRLQHHGPGLTRLFQAIQDPSSMPPDKVFRLETLSDEEILSQELDSDLLTSVFDWVPRSSDAIQKLSITPSPNKSRAS